MSSQLIFNLIDHQAYIFRQAIWLYNKPCGVRLIESKDVLIEGIFFLHGQNVIDQDWCPLCCAKTRFDTPVPTKTDKIEVRRMLCGHEIVYIFFSERICGEVVNVVRRRIR